MSKLIYIRAKREKTILFLCIEPKSSLTKVKTKLCEVLGNGLEEDQVRLLVDGNKEGDYTVLENIKSLENNDVVYFVYQNGGRWESVNVIEPELDEDDAEEEELPVAKKEKGKGRA